MSDALLSPAVAAGFYAASGAALGWSSAALGRRAENRLVPTMGVLGACVFAVQLLNFAIPGTGASGHLAGGMLLAAVLGAAPAFVVMTSVLLVQCLLFGDGGLLALGANLFNLGFVPCFVGLPLARALGGRAPTARRRTLALAAGAFASVELGALMVAVETVAAGATPLRFGPLSGLMIAIHLPIALAEAVVTAAAAGLLWRLAPEATATATDATAVARGWRRTVTALGLAAALGAGGLAWLASERPDGLEWSLAEATGTATGDDAAATDDGASAPVRPSLETSAAGLGGAAVVLAVSVALGGAALLWRRRRTSASRSAAPTS